MGKRFLAGILSVIMTMTLIPTMIFAKREVVTQAAEQEMITEISPGATNNILIDSGGTYILKGGQYDIDQSEIYINTTEPVTLRVDGNITLNGQGVFIRVVKPNNKVVIDGKKYKIESKDDGSCIFYNESKANVVFQGGTYETKTKATEMICNSENGIISVYDAVFKGIGESTIFSNYSGTLNIYSGSIESGKVNDFFCIVGGTVNVYGGTITTGMSYASAIRAEKVNFTGGKIINSRTGIDMYNGELTIGDDALFENNLKDISLHDKDKIHILQKGDTYTDSEGKAHKITKDWGNTAKVYASYLMDYNIKYPITTSEISENMLDHLIPLNQYYTIRYDKENQYYYLWRHVHMWDYSAEDQVITAECTSDPDCNYKSGITATIAADDSTYDEEKLDSNVNVENNISDITGEKATLLYVGRDGTEYKESEKEPTDAGEYTAKLTIAGNTICADFEIFKAEREAPDLTSKDETIFGKCDGQINGVNSDMEYRMEDMDYQEIKETSLSGLKPGTYYVRYKETKNYESSEETKIEIKEGNKIPVITKKDHEIIKKNPIEVKKITDMGLKIKQSAKQIKVSYNKVPNASEYDVYIQYCQYKFNKKSLVFVKNANTTSVVIKKINGKKINPKQNYKIYVVAYQKTNGKKKPIIKSITAHIAGRKNKKKTNVKAIKVSKATYQLKKGQSVKIKAKAVLQNKKKKQLGNDHAKQFRYVTSDVKVATVTKSGKIKALNNGTCDIYVYARNGCTKKIKVTVK